MYLGSSNTRLQNTVGSENDSHRCCIKVIRFIFFNHQEVKVRRGDNSRCWVLGSLLLKCSLLIQRTVWRNWKVSPVMWRPGTCCALCLKRRRSAGIDFSMMPRPPSSSKVVTWTKGKIKGHKVDPAVSIKYVLSKSLIWDEFEVSFVSPVLLNTSRGGWFPRKSLSVQKSWNIS